MNYEEFLDYIKENILEYYLTQKENTEPEEKETDSSKDMQSGDKTKSTSSEQEIYDVELHQVIKNNGIVLDSITILRKGEQISPNIYLNTYYDSYKMGKPISAIMDDILCQYQNGKAETNLTVDDITDFATVRDKIVLRLVNYEKNKEQLKNCPYKRYLDLAVTFRYIANKDAMGIASSLISNREFACWNIDMTELYQIALFNTMREFPWQMDSLVRIIANCLNNKATESLSMELLNEIQHLEEQEHGVNMFVLTNDMGVNGATCILYDNVIRNFARVQDSNLFLLPSSIHEIMIVPEDEDIEPEFLAELVVEANRSAVGYIDLLSDHIYYYDKEKDTIYIYGQND